MERNEKSKMLKQVSRVCTDTIVYAAPRYSVPAAELLPAGMVREREMSPYTDVQTALTSQTRTWCQGAVKKLVNIKPDDVIYIFNFSHASTLSWDCILQMLSK